MPKRSILSENFQNLDESMACLASGVARVHCALGQETFLHPPSTKNYRV